jgi:hypothetical protein
MTKEQEIEFLKTAIWNNWDWWELADDCVRGLLRVLDERFNYAREQCGTPSYDDQLKLSRELFEGMYLRIIKRLEKYRLELKEATK